MALFAGFGRCDHNQLVNFTHALSPLPPKTNTHQHNQQDLIKLAAEQGGSAVTDILLSQPLFKKDKDELDEAVDTAIKAAAELGRSEIVELLLTKFPGESKEHCKAGVFRALK